MTLGGGQRTSQVHLGGFCNRAARRGPDRAGLSIQALVAVGRAGREALLADALAGRAHLGVKIAVDRAGAAVERVVGQVHTLRPACKIQPKLC
jgi:hypothetical protein